MSSPTSDASSSHSSLDDAREQSTKDRRRERNRLAAQKHRLRRNERMAQLEQQVLALQQDKHQLLHRLENASTAAHSAAAAAGVAPPDLDALDHHPVTAGAGSPRPAKRARTSTSTSGAGTNTGNGNGNGTATAHHRAPVDPHPLEEPQAAQAQASLVRRMEERIVELERWHEELNGDLQDALDSEARLTAELHHTHRHADAHARRLADALQAAEAEHARLRRELAERRDALHAEARLRERLEGAEVALDLQRVENERLRERLAGAARAEDALDAARGELEDARAEARHLRKRLAREEQDRAGALLLREEDGRRRADAAEAHIAELTHTVHETQGVFAQQTERLERVQAELAESEHERRTLSDSVSSLQGALEKVRAFLTSKGIPIDLD